MVRILYFSWVRERVGKEQECLPLDAPLPLSSLVDRLSALSAAHAAAFAEPERLRAAINEDVARWDMLVRPGDEVAIFPPVTGG